MIEVNGEKKKLDSFYPAIEVPKRKRALFRRINYDGLKNITSTLDRGERNPPLPMHLASFKSSYDATLNVPLYFEAPVMLHEDADDFSTQRVHFYKHKVEQFGQTVYTEDTFELKGLGSSVPLDTTDGQQIFKMLMIHPWNAKNTKRSGKIAMFELVDIEAESKKRNLKTKSAHKAIALAFNEDEVPNSLAAKIHQEIGVGNTSELVAHQDYETIRFNLSEYASIEPVKFSKMVEDANLGLRGEIKRATDKGMIIQAKTEWLWGDIKTNKNNKLICVIGVGEEPVQELINHFVGTKRGKQDKVLFDTEYEAYKPI